MDNYVENVFKLNLPSHMQTYYVVNVENLQLCEPSLLDDKEDVFFLPH